MAIFKGLTNIFDFRNFNWREINDAFVTWFIYHPVAYPVSCPVVLELSTPANLLFLILFSILFLVSVFVQRALFEAFAVI